MSLFDTIGNLATAKMAYDLPEDAIGALRGASSQFATDAQQLGQQAAGATAFQPYSVRTAAGGMTQVGPEGGITQTVGAPQQAITSNLLQQAQQASTAAPVTAQSLFDQMQGMRQGETERAQLALENRLAAQGRLGTQTAAYGGTPEALALNKAIQEQQSADMLSAIQAAPELQGANLANLQSMLTGAYTPQRQELDALQTVSPIQQIIQAARQGESEALAELGSAGLQARAGGQVGVANLEAARAKAFGDALQGLFATSASQQTSQAQQAVNSLADLLGGLGSSNVNANPVAAAQDFWNSASSQFQ